MLLVIGFQIESSLCISLAYRGGTFFLFEVFLEHVGQQASPVELASVVAADGHPVVAVLKFGHRSQTCSLYLKMNCRAMVGKLCFVLKCDHAFVD